jgi:hypothetical protein
MNPIVYCFYLRVKKFFKISPNVGFFSRFFTNKLEFRKKYAQIGGINPQSMKTKKPVSDNFARFLAENTEESHGVEEIYRAIQQIPNPILRERVYQRMNVELGVILLRKAEIQEELQKIFEMEFLDEKFEKVRGGLNDANPNVLVTAS